MYKFLAVFLFAIVAVATAQFAYSGLGYTYPSAGVYNYPTVGLSNVGYYGVPSYGYAYPSYSNVLYYKK